MGISLVRPRFVPPRPLRELRDLTRYRRTQVEGRILAVQRLEKVLQDAGVKLTNVASRHPHQVRTGQVVAVRAGAGPSSRRVTEGVTRRPRIATSARAERLRVAPAEASAPAGSPRTPPGRRCTEGRAGSPARRSCRSTPPARA